MKKLLIADDERIIREGLYNSIDWRAMGIEQVFLAANGKQALDIIETEHPDIAVVDIVMPEITGLDLISYCTQKFYGTKFIIISGHSEFEFAQEAMRNKVVSYLLKPCDIDEISQNLINILSELEQKQASEVTFNKMKIRITHLAQVASKQLLRDYLTGVEISPENLSIIHHLSDLDKPKYRLLLLFATSDEHISMYPIIHDLVTITISKGIMSVDVQHNHTVLIVNEDEGTEIESLIRLIHLKATEYANLRIKFAYSDICTFENLPKHYKLTHETADIENISGMNSSTGDPVVINSSVFIYSKPIRQVMNYVMENLCDNSLSLKLIAQKVTYMNPDYLGKLFRKEYGKKYSDYLMTVRIKKAKQIIESTKDFRIYEIAQQIGLGDNVNYFSRMFRKYTGLLPSEYRAKVTNKKT